VIATNTMHIVVDEVSASAAIPVLSLLEVVGETIQSRGMETVGLLGTRFTMEHGFYQDALNAKGIEVLTPDAGDRAFVNEVIYDELVKGDIRDASRERYVTIVGELAGRGAEAVILGCTEIPLLIGQGDVALPLLDTTRLHAEAALQAALEP
jgi:aspartate racemase